MIISFIGVVGIVAQLLGYGFPNMPLWAWLVVVFLGFSIAQFLAFNKVRNERQSLESRFETAESRKEIGSALAGFHREAEGLISRKIADEKQMTQWINEVSDWKGAVESFINDNISPGEASIFSLVVVDGDDAKKKWGHQYNDDHKKRLHYLNNRLQKVAELIKRGGNY
jgi:hypothetical protein